ncbi:hypothetical protein JXQ70_15455 [bacterium]|nr:hypothetical protein [bacterium]
MSIKLGHMPKIVMFTLVILICFVSASLMIFGCSDDDDDDNQIPPVDFVVDPGSRAEVWYNYLTESDPDQFHKYGLYANRLIAVTHPEVYLEGDELFIHNVEGRELQPIYDDAYFHIFHFANIDLTKMETITTPEFYTLIPELFSYLDRRCMAAKSTIFTCRENNYFPKAQTQIKEIEKGVLYFCRIRLTEPGAAVYLLYGADESCYVWHNDTLYAMTDDTVVSPDRVASKQIALIFNEKSVWYPLMERDDTGSDQMLATLVDRFGDSQLPQLTQIEEYLLDLLKQKSKLDNKQERTLAALLAGKCNYSYGVRKEDANWIEGMDEIWRSVVPALKQDDLISMLGWYNYGSIDAILTKEIIIESNVLSPFTYLLGSHLPEDYDQDDLDYLTALYYYYGFYWGLNWELGIDTYNIDESYWCQGGACDVSAMNILSILNLKGVDSYLYMGYRGWMQYAHTLVYLPKTRSFFSNGFHADYYNSVFTGPEFPNALFYLHHNNDWSAVILESYYGNVEPVETAEWLDCLHSQFNDPIYGNSRQNGESVDVDPTEFLNALRSQPYNDAAVLLTLP